MQWEKQGTRYALYDEMLDWKNLFTYIVAVVTGYEATFVDNLGNSVGTYWISA